MLRRPRCHGCGKRLSPDRSECPRCGMSLVALCACGASVMLHATRCAACGVRRPGARGRNPYRRKWLILSAAGFAALLLAGVAIFRTFFRNEHGGRDSEIAVALEDLRSEAFESAYVRLRRLAEADPESASIHFWLGVAAERTGRSGEAVAEYRRAVGLDPGHAQAALRLGFFELEEGSREQARKLVEPLLGRGKESAQAHVLMARILRADLANPRDVYGHLLTAVEEGLDTPEVFDTLGRFLLADVRDLPPDRLTPEARQYLRLARDRLDPGAGGAAPDVDRLFLVARLNLALGEYEAAARGLRRCLSTPAAAPEHRLELARTEWARGNGDQARGFVEKLIVPETPAAVLLAAATLAEQRGDADLGARARAAAALHHGGDADVALALAERSLADRRTEQAEAALRKGLEANPRHPRLVVALARVIALGPAGVRGAEAWLREVLASSPDLVPAELALVGLLLDDAAEERRREARERLGRVAGGEGLDYADQGRVLLLEGRLKLEEGAGPEAIGLLEQAARALDREPEVHFRLADAWQAAGWPGRVAAELSIAMDLVGPVPEVQLRRAQARLSSGDAEGARTDCEQALAKLPGAAEGWLLLARALLDVRPPRPGDALRAVDRADAAGGATAASAALRAGALLAEGRPDRAEEVLAGAGAAGADPASGFALAMAAAAVEDQRAGRRSSDGALERIREFGRAHPGFPDAEVRLGWLLLDRGETVRAREELARATGAMPGSAKLWRLLVDARLEAGGDAEPDLPGAREAADRLAAVAPGSPEDLYARGRLALEAGDAAAAVGLLGRAEKEGPADPSVSCVLGAAAARAGDYARARLVLGGVLARNPESLLARRILARVAVAEGRAGLESGDHVAARGCFEEASRLVPGERETRALLALAGFRAGVAGDPTLLPKARAECEALVRQMEQEDGGDPQALVDSLLLLANIHSAMGDRDAMVAVSRRLVDLRPDDPALHLRRAAALFLADRPADALAALRESQAALPEDAALAAALASALEGAGLGAEALAFARDRAGRRPGDGAAQRTLGLAALRRGEPGEGEAAFRRAAEIDPQDLVAAEGVFEALAARGGPEEIVRALRTLSAATTAKRELGMLLGRALLFVDPSSREGQDLVRAATAEPLGSVRLSLEAHLTALEAHVLRGRPAEGAADAGRFVAWARKEAEIAPGGPLHEAAGAVFRTAGDLFAASGDAARAEAAYREAVARDPRDGAAFNNCAMLLAALPGRGAEAVDLARKGTDLHADRTETWDTLGRALLAADRPGEAEAAIAKALEILGTSDAAGSRPRADALVLLAKARWKAGRPDEARRTLSEALLADLGVKGTEAFREVEEGLR